MLTIIGLKFVMRVGIGLEVYCIRLRRLKEKKKKTAPANGVRGGLCSNTLFTPFVAKNEFSPFVTQLYIMIEKLKKKKKM